MFLGPFEQGGDYRDQGISGPHGFLARVWQSVLEAQDGTVDPLVERKMHQTIQQVTQQIADLHYNTAIAALMEYLNVVRAAGRTPRRAELEPLVLLLAPFAPHVAEELYQRLGHNDGLFDSARWPQFDPAKTVEDTVEVAVQVNGKLRARLVVGVGADEATVRAQALQLDNVARHVEAKTIRKVIFVPGKLLNLVVG
jgi:leucyl-tRNA synthetase